MKKRCTLEMNSKAVINAEIEILRSLIKKRMVEKTDKALCTYIVKHSDSILKEAKKKIKVAKCGHDCNRCPYYK